MSQNDFDKLKIKTIIWISAVLAVIIVLFSCTYIIKAGERGVLLTFGKPDMSEKTEGLHFKLPFIQKIVKMSVQTQKYEADLTAASRDLQDVNTKIAINYHIVPESVPEIYRDIGVNYGEKVIYPYEQETNKAITSQFTAEELITKRELVREQMKTELAEKLRDRGIVIEEISIVNFAFGQAFAQAIEAKVTAVQLKLKAENDLERIKIEAEQTIAKATAEAKALELQKQQITPELVELRKIEMQKLAIDKWNGIMPQTMAASLPFIDITAK